MKKLWLFFICLFSLMMVRPILGEEPKSGELSLPWSEFEKLFKLDKDEVTLTWEEFQKLIKQTGVQEMPDYQVQQGNVILSRAEFKKLLDRMKSPPAAAPKYFLTKSLYNVRIGQENTVVKASLRLEVVGVEDPNDASRIPLFPSSMALQEILMDNMPAIIQNDGNDLCVFTPKAGSHIITATFSTGANLKKPPHEVSFRIPKTPITQVVFTASIKNLDIKVANASESQRSSQGGVTEVRATLPTTDTIQATWNPVVPEKEKGPAKVYADVYNLLTIEEDALRTKTLIQFDILQNSVNNVTLRIPDGYSVLDVQGEAVGDWKVQGKNKDVLVIPFQFARSGAFGLTVTSEHLLKEKSEVAAFDGFEVVKAVREKGFVGVELKTTAEAKTVDMKGLDRVDTQELPAQLLNLATRPLLFGFKYLRQPFAMSLDIQRHKEVAVISTVIDEANGVTLVLEDGKRVTNLTFTVRNTWKQFLEISLPGDAQIWSAFVGGERVKPSMNSEGKVLIPLNRSRSQDGGLTGFDVELMYYQGTSALKPVGQEALQFPIPDVVVSQMLWSVYLPDNYDYLYFGGTVDKESRAEGISPLISVLGGAQKSISNLEKTNYQSYYRGEAEQAGDTVTQRRAMVKNSQAWKSRGGFGKGQALSDESYLRQMDQEFKFFNQVQSASVQAPQGGETGTGGVLPIRVKVPNTGKVFRFTKQIIVDQKPLLLTVVYLGHWMIRLATMLVFAGVILWIYRARKRLSGAKVRISEFLQKNEALITRLKSPMGSAIVTFWLTVVFAAISGTLGFLMAIVFAASLVRWGIAYYRTSKKGGV